MSSASDALKCLRSLCATRNLRCDATRDEAGNARVLVAARRGDEWAWGESGWPEGVYLHAHAAVLARYPRTEGRGGPNHTRATMAAKRARIEAEQAAARGLGAPW